jgi:hypothetical protein
MFDYWYTDLYGMKDYGEHMITHFCANKKEFVLSLSTAPKYYMVVHDEALKDLYARDAISSFNKDLNKAYFVIRGRNLYTALACPSILDLDPNFRKRRIHGMYHVYSAGKVAYYGRKKLNKLIPALMKMQIYNARPDPKNALDDHSKHIVPDFTDTFPLYKGVLLEKYMARKDKNMKGTVDDLMKRYGADDTDENGDPIGKKAKKGDAMAEKFAPRVKKMLDEGMRMSHICKKLNIGYAMGQRARLFLEESSQTNSSV